MAALGGSRAAQKDWVHSDLKRRFDESHRKHAFTDRFAPLASALGAIAAEADPPDKDARELRNWAVYELLCLFAARKCGSGLAFGELRRPGVVRRLRALLVKGGSRDEMDHFIIDKMVAVCVGATPKSTSQHPTASGAKTALGALPHLCALLADDRTAPKVVAGRFAPSLVLYRNRAAVTAVLQLVGGRLEKDDWIACIAEVALSMFGSKAGLSESHKKDLSEFLESMDRRHWDFHRIIRANSASLVERFAAELAGDRADAAKLALTMVSLDVEEKEGFGDNRPAKAQKQQRGTPSSRDDGDKARALRVLVGDNLLRLLAEVVQHKWWEKTVAEKAAAIKIVKGLVEHLRAAHHADVARAVVDDLGVLVLPERDL